MPFMEESCFDPILENVDNILAGLINNDFLGWEFSALTDLALLCHEQDNRRFLHQLKRFLIISPDLKALLSDADVRLLNKCGISFKKTDLEPAEYIFLPGFLPVAGKDINIEEDARERATRLKQWLNDKKQEVFSKLFAEFWENILAARFFLQAPWLMPDSLKTWQQIVATENKLLKVILNKFNEALNGPDLLRKTDAHENAQLTQASYKSGLTHLRRKPEIFLSFLVKNPLFIVFFIIRELPEARRDKLIP